MDLLNFSHSSKVWVYPIKNTLKSEQIPILEQKLAEFVSNWQSHGAKITAGYTVVDNKFIVISADSNCTAASGCSIDTMRKFISGALKAVDTEISDFSNIYFVKNNEIIEIDREQFSKLKSSGEISDRDIVYDLTPENLGHFLKDGIKKEFLNSWHSKVFKK